MNFSKQRIAVFLLLVASISLAIKLSLVNLSLPVFAGQEYAMQAIAYAYGDFAVHPKVNPGWPLFISIFFRLIESNNFNDYLVIVRPLGIFVSTATILPMYLLSRKFFNEKYSIVAASLFAFEPHINFNAGFGFTEPLYIFVIVLTVYFVLNKNIKFVYLTFALVGVLWWIRLEGVIMFFALSIIFFLNFKKSKNLIPKYLVCVVIFLIIVSPFLAQRYYQYDDPLYFYYNDHLFMEETYGDHQNFSANSTASDYIEQKGLDTFIHKFILTGIYQIFDLTARASFPYLFILLPFGALLALRPIIQEKKYVRANWIIILVYLGSLIIPLSVIQDKRFLYGLFPFFIIFATVLVERVVENGLSTFSFSRKRKNFSLIIFISGVLVSAILVLNYDIVDTLEGEEKIELAKFLVNNLNGKILYDGKDNLYYNYIAVDTPSGSFKDYRINQGKDPYVKSSTSNGPSVMVFKGDSLREILSNEDANDAKYIWIRDKNEPFNFLDDIFKNEEEYTFLKKVFDSNDKGFQKYHVKIFEINKQEFSRDI